MSDQQPENKQSSDEPAKGNHDTTSPETDPKENCGSSSAQTMDAEEPEETNMEQQLVRAGFPLMTPIDDTAHPLYLRYHHNQAGSGAAASVSGPYSREEAEEEEDWITARSWDHWTNFSSFWPTIELPTATPHSTASDLFDSCTIGKRLAAQTSIWGIGVPRKSPVLQMKQAIHRYHAPKSTPIRLARESVSTNVYEIPTVFSSPTTTSSAIKAEDPGEQLQRAAMPRTGLAVGVGEYIWEASGHGS
ncbi:hypothetical protein HDK77DRAFT_486084 [Phyllosticta capitalensis]